MGSAAQRHAVILAGGRGVRFWPRSRAARPKQLLSPLGGASLLRRTYERVRGHFAADRIWVVTSAPLQGSVEAELPEVRSSRVLAEPVQRNTAPAIGLAAALLLREDQNAVMGVFPADHHFERESAYGALLPRLLDATELDKLIVLGIEPTRPDTGYGYIEFPPGTRTGAAAPAPVLRFHEKPDRDAARGYLASRRCYWNSGQFFWKARALAEEMERYMPSTWDALARIADGDRAGLRERLRERYAACESASVDHGILERSARVAGYAAEDLGWSDIGSWGALHELLPQDARGNCDRSGGTFVEASGNYVDVPGKHVAVVGVDNLVVVETLDALMICPREAAQDIRSLEAALRAAGRDDLL